MILTKSGRVFSTVRCLSHVLLLSCPALPCLGWLALPEIADITKHSNFLPQPPPITRDHAPLLFAVSARHCAVTALRSSAVHDECHAQYPAHGVPFRPGAFLQILENYADSIRGRATAIAPIILTAPVAED